VIELIFRLGIKTYKNCSIIAHNTINLPQKTSPYVVCLYFQNVGAQELIEYRDNVIKVYDKNADGKLSRDELGMLLSVDK